MLHKETLSSNPDPRLNFFEHPIQPDEEILEKIKSEVTALAPIDFSVHWRLSDEKSSHFQIFQSSDDPRELWTLSDRRVMLNGDETESITINVMRIGYQDQPGSGLLDAGKRKMLRHLSPLDMSLFGETLIFGKVIKTDNTGFIQITPVIERVLSIGSFPWSGSKRPLYKARLSLSSGKQGFELRASDELIYNKSWKTIVDANNMLNKGQVDRIFPKFKTYQPDLLNDYVAYFITRPSIAFFRPE